MRTRRVLPRAAAAALAALLLSSCVVAGPGDLEEPDPAGWLTGRATATTLDVDPFGEESGLDVRFSAPGEDDTIVTVWWPGDEPVPEVGDPVEVAYDPEDPEVAVPVIDGVPAETGPLAPFPGGPSFGGPFVEDPFVEDPYPLAVPFLLGLAPLAVVALVGLLMLSVVAAIVVTVVVAARRGT